MSGIIENKSSSISFSAWSTVYSEASILNLQNGSSQTTLCIKGRELNKVFD